MQIHASPHTCRRIVAHSTPEPETPPATEPVPPTPVPPPVVPDDVPPPAHAPVVEPGMPEHPVRAANTAAFQHAA